MRIMDGFLLGKEISIIIVHIEHTIMQASTRLNLPRLSRAGIILIQKDGFGQQVMPVRYDN